MDKLFLAIGVLAALAAGFFAFNSFIPNGKQEGGHIVATPKDAIYLVDGQVIALSNGVSEVTAAVGSASKIVTRYFGNDVTADLNGDGRDDSVFLLTQEGGGSGTFYYVVAALNKPEGYTGSQAYFLGDRIAPQTTEFRDGLVLVNYADRAEGEPMTVTPSLGKTAWLRFDPSSMQFTETSP
jgi:hypothetical protein